MFPINIADFISTVGFPIALCCYFIYNQTQMQKQHKEETENIARILSEAINNNTIAINELKGELQNARTKSD